MQIHVARGGKKLGKFSPDEVRARLASGEFLLIDYGWTDGQTEWKPLSSFPGIATVPQSRGAEAVSPSFRGRTAPAHNQPAPSSGMAITSLIAGLLSVTILPFVASIPAVICGHIARSNIKKSNGRLRGNGAARAGLILGYIGVVILVVVIGASIFTGIPLPVFQSIQVKAKQTKSLHQARQVVVACKLYAADHRGAFPKRLEELVPNYLSDPKVLVCPLSPDVPIGYAYYGGRDTDPPTKILLVSKAASQGKQRVVVRVDTSGEIARNMPELPAHSW